MRKDLDRSRLGPSCFKVGERAEEAANPPTGFGRRQVGCVEQPAGAGHGRIEQLLDVALGPCGPFNVRRRGEPPDWRQSEPDL